MLALVQLRDEVQHPPPVGARHARRILEVQHRIARAAQLAALVLAGQESAAPEARRQRLHVAEALGDQHDEGRQVRVRAAEAVAHPRAEGRAAGLLAAGLEECDTGLVVDGLGVHRAHEAELARDTPGMRHQLADPGAVLLVRIAAEAEHRRRDGEAVLPAGHAGQALPLADRVGQVLVEAAPQFRLVVEEVELAGRALHVHVDDALRARAVVDARGRHLGAGGERGLRPQQGPQRDTAQRPREPGGARLEESPAGQVEEVLFARVHGVRSSAQSFVRVSCRFRAALAIIVQAASSTRSTPSSAMRVPSCVSSAASAGSSAKRAR